MDEGVIGRPYHLNLRYYSGFWAIGPRTRGASMLGESGGGISGDLASHWGDHARWLYGKIEAVTAVFFLPHRAEDPRPDAGRPSNPGEDSAMLLLEFESGARDLYHVTSLAYEPGPFGQRHEMDLPTGPARHAAPRQRLDARLERVDGSRRARPKTHELPIPDQLYAGARRGSVHETYKDVFREQDSMTRGFVSAIASGSKAAPPDFSDGLAVQRLLEAASRSARDGRRVDDRGDRRQ